MFLINPYILQASGAIPTTNLFAYSFRKVIPSATVSCRVRRSSDNVEQDIGFVGGDLDTASLLSFIGANSGYVVKMYEQSGSGQDLNQSTGTNQFTIVSAGTLYTLNGKATCLTSGIKSLVTPLTLFTPNINVGTTVFSVNQIISVYNVLANFDYSIGDGTSPSGRLLDSAIGNSGTTPTTYNSNSETVSSISTAYSSGTKLKTHFTKNGDNRFYINGASVGTNTTSLTSITSPVRLVINGASFSLNNGNVQCNQYFSEILMYNSYETSNQSTIESNINSYYSIY